MQVNWVDTVITEKLFVYQLQLSTQKYFKRSNTVKKLITPNLVYCKI